MKTLIALFIFYLPVILHWCKLVQSSHQILTSKRKIPSSLHVCSVNIYSFTYDVL